MQKTKRVIQIASPYLGEEEWNALREPLFSGWVTQGPQVKQFENDFATRHGVKHAVAVSNCTTALHLALLAAGIGPGDEVIVPSFTWVATANAVLYCGATPVFVDIDLRTFNIDPGKIREKITGRTKAVIPVHLFGLCADMDEVRNASKRLKLVEDAACAAGAGYKGTPAGGLGDLGCFSFHPRKSVTTGEGGMVTTQNDRYAAEVDRLRNHGASVSEEQRHKGPQPYILPGFEVIGYNYRMTDLQGAVGVVQMKKLDTFIDERNKWAGFYKEQFSEIDWLTTPLVPDGYRHGWQSYVLLVDEKRSPHKRNEIMQILQEQGVSTRPGTHAVHLLDIYKKKFGIKPAGFPNSFSANELSMSIPLHNRMTEEDYHYVAAAIKSIK